MEVTRLQYEEIEVANKKGFKYLASDKSGITLAYEMEPIRRGDQWTSDGGIDRRGVCYTFGEEGLVLRELVSWEDKWPLYIGDISRFRIKKENTDIGLKKEIILVDGLREVHVDISNNEGYRQKEMESVSLSVSEVLWIFEQILEKGWV